MQRQHLEQLLARLAGPGLQHSLHAMDSLCHLLIRGVLRRRGEQQPAKDTLAWAGECLNDVELADEHIAGEVCRCPSRLPGCPRRDLGGKSARMEKDDDDSPRLRVTGPCPGGQPDTLKRAGLGSFGRPEIRAPSRGRAGEISGGSPKFAEIDTEISGGHQWSRGFDLGAPRRLAARRRPEI